MDSFSGFLLYIPGIIIFLVGSGQIRQWLGLHSGGMTFEGTVISCKHVVKKDKKDREIYNYYDLLVELVNPKTGKTEKPEKDNARRGYAACRKLRLQGHAACRKPRLQGHAACGKPGLKR